MYLVELSEESRARGTCPLFPLLEFIYGTRSSILRLVSETFQFRRTYRLLGLRQPHQASEMPSVWLEHNCLPIKTRAWTIQLLMFNSSVWFILPAFLTIVKREFSNSYGRGRTSINGLTVHYLAIRRHSYNCILQPQESNLPTIDALCNRQPRKDSNLSLLIQSQTWYRYTTRL